MTDPSSTSKRSAFLMSCAALATSYVPQAALAQAFQGTITSSTGSVTRAPTTSTTETITVASSKAIINWAPSDTQKGGGAINFLPNGNTATFTSAQGITDYTVLNRIIPTDPTRPIALNGHVISTLQGTNSIGGKVWFFSPGGIVVGASAVFDVGGLLLTTNDVSNFTPGPQGFSAAFGAATNSPSKVQIQSGAQVNAVQPGSYVAVVSPRIEQSGDVRVNGSAAYVAGEKVALTMNQGLFDIQVFVGTSDANGVVHDGSTTGPANAAESDNHSIYMVAVPKNQALTMLLGGTVGFDSTTAAIANGQILLSAGYDVSGSAFGNTASAGAPANLSIDEGHFTSNVSGTATGQVLVSGGGTGAAAMASSAHASSAVIKFDDDATFHSDGDLNVTGVSAGKTLALDAGGDLSADQVSAETLDLTAGQDLSVGNATATGEADLTAGGIAGFTGTLLAPMINVTSHGIDIGDQASLGVAGTTKQITLNAESDGVPVLIGDGSAAAVGLPSATGQYQLTNIDHIHTASLTINASASGDAAAPDVDFLNATIAGSSTSGGGIGSMTVNSPASIFLDGKVLFQDAAASDQFSLNAHKGIELNTDKGSLAMTDSGGKLGGILNLAANTIWVADSALLSQLEANPNFAGRADALKTNNGPNKPEGFIQAGTVKAYIADSMFVQNSGTPTLFAGISVDDGGLTVNAKGPGLATVIAYGREVKSDGTILNNTDFFKSVAFVPPGTFTSDSTLNGCTIGGGCAGEPPSIVFEWSSMLVPVGSGNGKGKDADRIIDTEPLFADDSVDEPVTSGSAPAPEKPADGPQ
jgi:filamentous hemagglutinin family protein